MKVEDINTNERGTQYLNDDLIYFMYTDPAFYRKKFFPFIIHIRDNIKKADHKILMNKLQDLVKDACIMYKYKFNIEDRMKHLFTLQDVSDIANTLFNEIKTDIANGHYHP